jgi:uncharacterized membrane protein (UPF0127 family)
MDMYFVRRMIEKSVEPTLVVENASEMDQEPENKRATSDVGTTDTNKNTSALPRRGAFSPEPPTDVPGERYPTAPMNVYPADGSKSKTIHVRVADTPSLRAAGLQNTAEPEDYHGVFMSWPGDAQATLHNRNVSFPVAAVYFDSSGMYRDHQLLKAGDPTPVPARVRHRHVLEVPKNKFAALGLGPGARVSMAEEEDQSRNGTINLGD